MNERRQGRLAAASLCLLPLLWLWPSLFGGRTFVPYDLAEFPPASLLQTEAEHAAVRQGANHDVTEVPPWFLPELRLARDELLAGRVPSWNPHARGGSVLHAHGLLGLCYPPNWLALFAAEPAARLAVLAWLSLALGGLLAYGLWRELGLAPFPAWFGALLFELSAPMASNAHFWMRLASFVWLPGVLWALLRLARDERRRAGPLAACAGAFAATWLGGFPPFAATTTVFAGAFGLWLVVERARQQSWRAGARLGARLLLGLLLGGLLSLPQVLPSLQFFPHSARTPTPTEADIAGSAFEAYGLTGYLVPELLGTAAAADRVPAAQSPLALLWTTRTDAAGKAQLPNYNATEYALFVGTFGLLLAIGGAIAGRGRRRGFALAAYAVALGLALLLPGVRLLFHLPVVQNVWPLRWLAPATLLVAWLAALGCERLLADGRRCALGLGALALVLAGATAWGTRQPAARHAADPTWAVQRIAEKFEVPVRAVVDHVQAGAAPGADPFTAAFARAAHEGAHAALWLVLSAALLLAAGLVHDRARRWLVRAGAALTLLQLALHGAPLLSGCALAHPTDTPVHAFLRQQAAAAAADGGFTIVRASRVPTLPAQLPPGQLMVPGVRDLHFYSHFDGRSAEPLAALLGPYWGPRTAAKGYLVLSLPDALPAPGEPEPHPPYPFASPLEHPLLDLLGVRYVLATEPLPHGGPRVGPALAGPRGQFFVHERPRPLPRAFTVPLLRPLARDADVVAALVDPGLAPRAAALVL
ncbi:MAG: hypothetical protein KF830_18280, partial [Planctomycetes bacterium]|nr:hypothetical protein [Planctomycetota bacterium]